MNSPELSIIIPVYNVAPYINDCLSSIKNQSFKDWECILIDDGSTDFSGLICDSYAKKDSRFKVIHQKNAGVSAARNIGIKNATAPYMTFIDPDDYISLNYFEDSIAELLRNNAELSVGITRFINEKGIDDIVMNQIFQFAEGGLRQTKYQQMPTNKDVVDALCINFFSCVCWGKIYRRTLWGEARFPIGIDLGEDMMTVPQVIVKANSAVSVPSSVYYYRQRERSLLHGTVTRERFFKDVLASREMREQLNEYAPERKSDFNVLKFQYDIGCCVNYIKSNHDKPHGSILFELQKMYEETGKTNTLNTLLNKEC